MLQKIHHLWHYIMNGIFLESLFKIKRKYKENSPRKQPKKTGNNIERESWKRGNYTNSTKLELWAPILAKMSAASLPVQPMWVMDQKMCLPKPWMLFLIMLMNLKGALLMSLNQATALELYNFNTKTAEEDQREATAKRRPSLIANISIRMAESTVISLPKWSKMLSTWSRKIPSIPLLKVSVKKDSSTLILIIPKVGGVQELLREERRHKGTETTMGFR